ncbi:MAG: hypothetical protein QXJ64_03505 [Thermosphaera sp.]
MDGYLSIVTYIVLFASGLGFGIFIGLLVQIFRFNRDPLLGPLMKSGIVGISYDVDQNTIDLVPLEHVARGVYFSMDAKNPMIVMKPEDVSTIPMSRLRKSALLLISKKPHGMSVNPETLAKVGIASISLSKDLKEKFSSRELSHRSYIELISELLKLSKDYVGEIKVSPELKLGISFNIPEVAKAMMSILVSLSLASLEGLKDNLLSAKAFLEYMKYRMAGAREGWTKYLVWLLMAGIAVAIIFLIIQQLGGRG